MYILNKIAIGRKKIMSPKGRMRTELVEQCKRVFKNRNVIINVSSLTLNI